MHDTNDIRKSKELHDKEMLFEMNKQMAKKWKCKSCGDTKTWRAVKRKDGTLTDFCSTCHFTQKRL